MRILPAINCPDTQCVLDRLRQSDKIFQIYKDREPWVHIDVADGGFTRGHSTWRNPKDLSIIKRKEPFKIEIHLMVNTPEEVLEPWLNQGIDRLVFHLESTSNVNTIINLCENKEVDPMLAISPGTSAGHAFPYLGSVKSCQVLAVNPGQSAQDFQEEIIDKIKQIKEKFPEIMLEVDGGITLETGKRCVVAGADQLVSSSYIFRSPDPIQAYRELCELG